jgi:hypothetical protein
MIQGAEKTKGGFRYAEHFKTTIYFHCGGLDSNRHETRQNHVSYAILGFLMDESLGRLFDESRRRDQISHFVTARETVYIILASCDGRGGDAGGFRDYRPNPIPATRAC